MMMKTFVKVKVLGHHGIIWGYNISGQGTCHRDDTDMSSCFFFLVIKRCKLTFSMRVEIKNHVKFEQACDTRPCQFLCLMFQIVYLVYICLINKIHFAPFKAFQRNW